MRRAILLSGILFLLQVIILQGQTRADLHEMFSSAEGDILFEDYAEALPKYLILLQHYPENYNIYYRIGQCYLNTPGEKKKAIPYLESAAANIDPAYKEVKLKETKAPYDAIYYLANAYRINNELDKALDAYKRFLTKVDPAVYDTSLVNFQIRTCYVAKKMISNPTYIIEKNIGKTLNDRFSEFDPVVSSDEKTIVFTRALQFYDAVFYSRKIDGKWTQPVNMTPQLGVDQDYYSSSLSSDGSTLILYRTDNYEGNIYLSRYIDGRWTKVEKLNDNINTKYWESHATVSHDGKRLWFASNRKGGYGGLDIYYSERDSTGDWGVAVNAGPVINTKYDDDTPFLSQNDRILYFSSRGHYNMGGYDIFYSTLSNGKWTEPVNMGYPLNTTDDDLFYSPVGDGSIGYYSRYSADGFGKMDIYRCEVFSGIHPRKFSVSGIVKISNLLNEFPQDVRISAENINDKSIKIYALSDPQTGAYSLIMPQGSFAITYSAEGAEKKIKNIDIPVTHKGDTINIENILLLNNDFTADLKVIADTTATVTTKKPVLFKIISEPSSLLEIAQWNKDSLIKTERFRLTDSTFSYEIMPREGFNKIIFALTDRFGNKKSASLEIDASDSPKIKSPQYEQAVSQEQIKTLLGKFRKYAGEDLRKVIDDIDPSAQQFGTADELIAFLKEKAREKNIDPEVIDRLALEIALKENVLTQSSTDLLASGSKGKQHEALSNLNIYDVQIRSWDDLAEYETAKTGNDVHPEELRALAEYILLPAEKGIKTIHDKALVAGNYLDSRKDFEETVQNADSHEFKYAGEYLVYLSDEGENRKVIPQVIKMKAALSHKPDESAKELLDHLREYSGDRLKLFLSSVDLKKENINSPEELIAFLETAAKNGLIDKLEYNKALASLIISKDLKESEIKANLGSESRYGLLKWIALGTVLIILILIIFRKKKKED